jgi:hypothetical protein
MPAHHYTPYHARSRGRLIADLVGNCLVFACMIGISVFLLLPWGEGIIKPEKGLTVPALLFIIPVHLICLAVPGVGLALAIRELHRRAIRRSRHSDS